MINIEKDGVEPLRAILRCQSPFEKITMNKAAAGIGNQTGTERDEPFLVPLNDRREIIDHDQRSDTVVLQCGPCCITEPEASDNDIKRRFSRMVDRCRREPEGGKGLLHDREETRHEVGITEENLVDLTILKREESALSKNQIPERGLTVVEFFEEG